MKWKQRWCRWAGAVVLPALVVAGCGGDGGKSSESSSSARSETSDDPSTCDGSVEAPDTRFVVDACGRVVFLRGVNVEGASKGETQADPHLPSSSIGGQAALGQWGWNVVRFLVFWGAIEPNDGTFDEKYLDGIEKWLDAYADSGVHVVLDMHQDLYAWKVNGNGAPDWAVETNGLEVKPIADGMPWYLQGADPAVQAAYQSFWNPPAGARDFKVDYLEALAHLAERFADHPAVIGYDVMNEPSFANGDLAATLAIQPQAAAGEFHNPNLTKFMQGGIDAVRTADQDAWVMVAPTALLNAFPYAGDLIGADLRDPRSGPPRIAYAGHLYQPSVHDGAGYPEGDPYLAKWEQMRTAEAAELKGSLWFGEWGGNPDQDGMERYVHEVLSMSDRTMSGWAWWSWDPGGWSPVEADGTTPSPNGRALMRVQPRAVAGTPSGFAWDPATKRFTMSWDERDDVEGPTELAVPVGLYPEGIEVVVDGKTVADPQWERDKGVVELDVDRSPGSHELCLAAAGSTACQT